MKKEKLISIIIGSVILLAIIIIAVLVKNKDGISKNVTELYGAVGGGKEDLLADEEINKVFEDDYRFKFVQDVWSNGKTVKVDVRREDGTMYDVI